VGPRALAACLGGLLALEAMRLITRLAPPQMAGRVLHVDFFAPEMTYHRVLRMPRCPACGYGKRRAVAPSEGWRKRGGGPLPKKPAAERPAAHARRPAGAARPGGGTDPVPLVDQRGPGRAPVPPLPGVAGPPRSVHRPRVQSHHRRDRSD